MITKEKHIAIAMGWPYSRPAIKLDVSEFDDATPEQVKLIQILRDETERARDADRSRRVKAGLLEQLNYVDRLPWDEFLLDPSVALVCAQKAGLPPADVLQFVLDHCDPTNWRGIFFMQALIGALAVSKRRRFDDLAALEKAYADSSKEKLLKQTKSAKLARREIGAEVLAKIARIAEPLRGKSTKVNAAKIIASAIGKSDDYVRRKLSELFPGDSWNHKPK